MTLSRYRGARALIALLALIGPAAQAAPVDEDLVEARDMALLYQRVCLRAFPDEQAVQAALKDSRATPLGLDAVSALLHSTAGAGWVVTTAVGAYRVTIEKPPFNTCAVRRTTPDGLATAMPYIVGLQDYARSNSLLLGQVEPLEDRTAEGARVEVLATPMGTDPRAKPTEESMYTTTTTQDQGTEIKMSHHIAARD
jgi:hypothetical protein